jgi:hypothetical protein
MPKRIDDLLPKAKGTPAPNYLQRGELEKASAPDPDRANPALVQLPKAGVRGVWHRIAALRVSGDISLAFPWG